MIKKNILTKVMVTALALERKGRMKKKLLFLALCACITFAGGTSIKAASDDVVIDEKSFPDGFLRSYVLKNIDTNKDRVLQREEAEAVTKLNLDKFETLMDADGDGYVYFKEEDFAFDCKGLEYFTNAEVLRLRLSGGKTTEGKTYPVKVSNGDMIYKLRKLKELKLNKGDYQSFDSSYFPEIEKLSLYGFNRIEKVNLKGNPKLWSLHMEDMSIDTIDVSDYGSMTYMDMYGVDVKNIKFGSKNKVLKTLRYSYFHSNDHITRLKTLDLSKLTGLKRLSLNDIKTLKKIDLSQNRKLCKFGIAFCEKITEISLVNCKNLTFVSLSSCKNLRHVTLENCKKLATIEIKKNPGLKSLFMKGINAKEFLLGQVNKIESFRCVNAGLKKFNVKNLNPKTLKKMYLQGNKFKKLNVKKYKKLKMIKVDKGVKVSGAKKLRVVAVS